MSERSYFMLNWPGLHTEVWHIFVDGVKYQDYYFPEDGNLEDLVEGVIERVETESRRVASYYLQPDNHELRIYTRTRLLLEDEDSEDFWTL